VERKLPKHAGYQIQLATSLLSQEMLFEHHLFTLDNVSCCKEESYSLLKLLRHKLCLGWMTVCLMLLSAFEAAFLSSWTLLSKELGGNKILS